MLSIIPLCRCTTFYLSIHQLVDNPSVHQLSRTVLLWALVYRLLDGDTFSIFLGTCLGVELLNDYFSNLTSLTIHQFPMLWSVTVGLYSPTPKSILSGPHAFPTQLFPLRCSSLLLSWVQILSVTKDPAQLSLPPQTFLQRRLFWESCNPTCLSSATRPFGFGPQLFCAQILLPSWTHSLSLHLDSGFWIHFHISSALHIVDPE